MSTRIIIATVYRIYVSTVYEVLSKTLLYTLIFLALKYLIEGHLDSKIILIIITSTALVHSLVVCFECYKANNYHIIAITIRYDTLCLELHSNKLNGGIVLLKKKDLIVVYSGKKITFTHERKNYIINSTYSMVKLNKLIELLKDNSVKVIHSKS